MKTDDTKGDEVRRQLEQYAHSLGIGLGAALAQLLDVDTLKQAVADHEFDAAARKLARERYATDNLEVDEDAELSHADDGVWVGAWVWLPHDDVQALLEDKGT